MTAAGTIARSAMARAMGLAVLLVIGSLAAACGGGDASGPSPLPTPARSGPDITGVVWQFSDAGNGTGSLLVVGLQGAPGGYDRASVRLTKQTTWQTGHGSPLPAPALDRELIGRRVAVTFTGAVAESYPVQATASAVTLLDPLGVSMFIDMAGPPTLTGKALEAGRNADGVITTLTVLPDETQMAGAPGSQATSTAGGQSGDVIRVTVKVTRQTAWVLDTPTQSKSTQPPLIGNGVEPKVSVRVEGGAAVWVIVHLRDVYVGG